MKDVIGESDLVIFAFICTWSRPFWVGWNMMDKNIFLINLKTTLLRGLLDADFYERSYTMSERSKNRLKTA